MGLQACHHDPMRPLWLPRDTHWNIGWSMVSWDGFWGLRLQFPVTRGVCCLSWYALLWQMADNLGCAGMEGGPCQALPTYPDLATL